MNYTAQALLLLDQLEDTSPPERIAEIKRMAEALATAERRRFVGKGHVSTAVSVADSRFLEESHT